ncbi:MAG: N-acetylneuraminate synthase family protein [Chloroflexi bacterium]|nr:N-acetylneuraminate synthase family protein [Chloroflexota bacterium]
MLKQTELTDDDFRTIKAYWIKGHPLFMCAPWDEPAWISWMIWGANFKVASADLVNWPLLERMVATGKPLILSSVWQR